MDLITGAFCFNLSSYPLPLILTVIEQMHSVQYFTKLDLCSAYNLVHIREGEEWKAAFITSTGH
jgi:hypothetical protein